MNVTPLPSLPSTTSLASHKCNPSALRSCPLKATRRRAAAPTTRCVRRRGRRRCGPWVGGAAATWWTCSSAVSTRPWRAWARATWAPRTRRTRTRTTTRWGRGGDVGVRMWAGRCGREDVGVKIWAGVGLGWGCGRVGFVWVCVGVQVGSGSVASGGFGFGTCVAHVVAHTGWRWPQRVAAASAV